MILKRLILALMVGLNLTLVCQGHHNDEHATGPHLALVDEVEDPAAAPETSGRSGATFVDRATSCAPARGEVQVLASSAQQAHAFRFARGPEPPPPRVNGVGFSNIIRVIL